VANGCPLGDFVVEQTALAKDPSAPLQLRQVRRTSVTCP
jgi:hypothetical protein